MPTRVRSYCKINLGLAVGSARGDGFHALTTMYQTVDLHDMVAVSAKAAAETRIALTANHPGVPRTEAGNAERNTAWKMVAGALNRLGISAEVSINIDKRLPVQGGLGAGSANAAAALLGLERELGTALPGPERLLLAAEVGSDVPLFLLGGAVLGLGRGEQVFPLPDGPPVHCVVAVPRVGVSTAQAFRELDARMSAGINDGTGGSPQGLKPLSSGETYGTAEAMPFQNVTKAWTEHADAGAGRAGAALTFQQGADRLEELSRALAAVWITNGAEHGPSGITRRTGDLAEITGSPSNLLYGVSHPLLALVRTGIENDFEEVVFSQHPSLRSTKRNLVGDGLPGDPGNALHAALSGSGSALFGLYRNQADARAAQQRVQAAGTQALLTETLPRAEYWGSMFAE